MTHAPDTDRMDRRLRAAGFLPDKRGVSEIVGSLLLIGITVLLVGGLAILILNVKPPADTIHADLDVLVTRGPDGVWGSGDEQLRVDHVGGEPVPKEGFSIQVDIGGTTHSFAGAGLTGAFDDGELTIGETWATTLTVPIATAVDIQMLLEGGGQSSIIHSSTIMSGGSCDPDNDPPSVTQWTQSPSDVTALTTGSVTVTVKLIDACSGVDEGAAPTLQYRINSGSDPAWTTVGPMTDAGTATWSGTIPSQNWLLQLGNSLQYRVTGMKDIAGNTATSGHQSDVIQFVGGSQTYTNGHTANVGTVSNFANAQSATDGGAVATLTESASTPPTVKYATSASGSGGSGSPNNVHSAPDNTYYVLNSNNDQVTVTTFGTGSGTINKVEFIFEGHYQGTRNDDTVDLRADAGSGFNTVLNDYVPNAGTDAQRVVDITGLRPSWSWSDINGLDLRAVYDRNSGQDAMTVHVDAMWVRVSVASNTDMDIELRFPALPASVTHVLEVNYAVTGDTFNVQVWNGALTGWVTRGTTLNQASQTTWVYQLTAAEAIASSGAPLIRIVDSSGASSQGTVTLDFVRVVSA